MIINECLDASYRNILSANILSLQEKGKITALKNKWWKEKRGGGSCQVRSDFAYTFFLDKIIVKHVVVTDIVFQDNVQSNEASELSMKNVGGVFIVLCSGVGVAAILACFEMFWKLWKTSAKKKVFIFVIDFL